MKKLESEIKSVIVYKDRAMVKRFATLNLEKDEHTLVFENLPLNIEKNSIQVNGSEGLTLQDIKFETKYISELPNNDKNELLANRKKIEDKIKEINEKSLILEKEKTFVDSIVKKIVETETSENNVELDPEKWFKMVDFTRNRYDKIDNEIRNYNIQKEELQQNLKSINFDLSKYDKPETRINNQVIIKISNIELAERTIQLNYIVYGPSWYPVYDLRVVTETKKMSIEYNALVTQKTGENWENVKVQLSTAQAQISGTQPELSPWYLNFYTYQAASYSSPKGGMMRSMDKKSKSKMEFAKEVEEEGDYDEFINDNIAMAKPVAKVETGATSVVFVVAGKNTIDTNGETYKVCIMVQEFNAEFKYSAVPKLIPYSYLKAKVKNESEFPFLPGESHIFLDGNFVANSNFNLVIPNEEFFTSLGVDEGMKVEYKFLKKYEKEEGVFSKKRKLIFEYNIIITNNKKSDEEVTIFDQLPISSHQDIIIELIEPKFKENTEELKKDELNKFTWKFTIKNGDKKIIPFKYSIEYPREQTIMGI